SRVAQEREREQKAAGEVLTAKQAPHRPGIAPALGLRAGGGVLSILPQTAPSQEVRAMWFPFSLPSRQRPSPSHPDRRKRSFVPRLESLEGRDVLSTLTVLNNLDKGAGSLRDAIARARNGDTIAFAPALAGRTIALTSGSLDIMRSLDIQGPGAGLLAVSGSDTSRVFDISEGLAVTIAGLTITPGRAGGSWTGGGGILNVGSRLTLANDVLSDNVAVGGGFSGKAQGGAVTNLNGGALTVTGSTFVGNRADARVQKSLFGAVGAMSQEDASAAVIGCTCINNKAFGGSGGVVTNDQTTVGNADGGGIFNVGAGGVLTVLNSTFTGNQAIAGSGGSVGKDVSFYFL